MSQKINKLLLLLFFYEQISSSNQPTIISEGYDTSSNAPIISSEGDDISSKINPYFAIILFIFGIVGNVLNTFVFAQGRLRSNSCAWLFRLSSIFNLISILFGLTTGFFSSRILDITNTNDYLCKLRVFILLYSRTIASWLLTLAVLDLWLLSCSNNNYRSLSELKYTKRGITIIAVVSGLTYSPIFYCYQANLVDQPLACYTKTTECRRFSDYVYAFVTIIIPIIFMILFSCLTMSNVRQLHHRAEATVLLRFNRSTIINQHRQRLRSSHRHLCVMLIVQIVILFILTTPQVAEMIYLTKKPNEFKSSSRKTTGRFRFTLLLTYLASAVPFYIYASTSAVFRKELCKLIRHIGGQIPYGEH